MRMRKLQRQFLVGCGFIGGQDRQQAWGQWIVGGGQHPGGPHTGWAMLLPPVEGLVRQGAVVLMRMCLCVPGLWALSSASCSWNEYTQVHHTHTHPHTHTRNTQNTRCTQYTDTCTHAHTQTHTRAHTHTHTHIHIHTRGKGRRVSLRRTH